MVEHMLHNAKRLVHYEIVNSFVPCMDVQADWYRPCNRVLFSWDGLKITHMDLGHVMYVFQIYLLLDALADVATYSQVSSTVSVDPASAIVIACLNSLEAGRSPFDGTRWSDAPESM